MVITKDWETGGGAVTITYDGDGDGTISVSSDVNSGAPRQMVLAVSNDYGQSVDLTVKQEGAFIPVEYLESDGENVMYIVTDYVPSGDKISYETKFKWDGYNSTNTYIRFFAARTSTSTQGFQMWRFSNYANRVKVYCGQRGQSSYGNFYDLTAGRIYTLKCTPTTYNFVGTARTFDDPVYATLNTYEMFLWPKSGLIYLRYYYFKMWDDGVLKLDLIPVRVGNVGYMYDRVTGNLYGNSGSGNFIIGPDL